MVNVTTPQLSSISLGFLQPKLFRGPIPAHFCELIGIWQHNCKDSHVFFTNSITVRIKITLKDDFSA